MTHTNKMSYFASFCALNHLILQISSSKTILFCIFLWVMLVLVDLRVLEEEGENRDGRWSNLNKKHFFGTGSWVGVRSVFSRSSLGKIGEGKEKIKRREILRKVLFREKAPEYHSGAINKEKHLQGRCCDQWAQKCLGSRDMLNHASGTSGLWNLPQFSANTEAQMTI